MKADNSKKSKVVEPVLVVSDETKEQVEGLGQKISNTASATYESGKEIIQNIPGNVESVGIKIKDVAVDIGEGVKGAVEQGIDYAKEGYQWTKKKSMEGYEWTKATGTEGVEWVEAKFSGEKA